VWDLSPYLPLFLIWAMVFGPLTGWLAGRRQRQRLVWLVYGGLLGPLALLIVALAPPGQCPACEAPLRGWAYVCPACGRQLRGSVGFAEEGGGKVGAAAALPPLPPVAALPPLHLPTTAPGRGSSPSPTATDGPAGTAHTTGGPPATAPGQAVLLAVGYFVGGSEALTVGARYAILRRHDVLQIQGPVDVGPGTVLLEHALEALEVSAIGNRLVVSGVGDRRRHFVVAFQIVAGLGGNELERGLDVYWAAPAGPAVHP